MRHPLFPLISDRPVGRRSFFQISASLAAAAVWSSRAEGRVLSQPTFSDYPFSLGVASGDPSSDGFVIWTRLAPKPLEGGGMPAEPIRVEWQVATDEKMKNVVRRGQSTAVPEWGHSVHVEVDGLEPSRWYYYQFKAGSETSPVARTKTFPASTETPDNLRFAFASCQHYESGYYTAYEYMAKDDLDLIVHLGDYIYEGGISKDRTRKHNSAKIISLDDYRNRHSLYKSDPLLQNAHQLFPWIVTWDDHEFENNYANDISENDGIDPAKFLEQRASAYQAYYEHMPLRRSSLPHKQDMALYRKISFGPLANFYVLDTRQYRTDQPCGDGLKPRCEAVMDPEATILGEAQRRWLFDELASSNAKWNVLAQQVMMAGVSRKGGEEPLYGMDIWTGYEMDRRRVLKAFEETKVSNPVVITGDIHSNWANDLVIDFESAEPRTVASEFVGTSISSSGNGTAKPKGLEKLLADNPCVKLHNQQRGYVRCEVNNKEWRGDYQVLDFVEKPGSPINTLATFVVESDQKGLKKS